MLPDTATDSLPHHTHVQGIAYRDLTPPQYQSNLISHEEGIETEMVDREIYPTLFG